VNENFIQPNIDINPVLNEEINNNILPVLLPVVENNIAVEIIVPDLPVIQDNIIVEHIVVNNRQAVMNDAQIIALAAAIRGAENGTRASPALFSGRSDVNANIWWLKFINYCNLNHIAEANQVAEFSLLISGVCENWFSMLLPEQKNNIANLHVAFGAEYANVNVNVVEREIFYARRQMVGEAACTFIDDMANCGNRLNIEVAEILRVTKRGLLPDIYAYILDKVILNVSDLKQKVQMRELINSYSNLNAPVSAPRVHFATAAPSIDRAESLQTTIDKLTSVVDKLHLSALDTPLNRGRSPMREDRAVLSPARSPNRNQAEFYSNQYNQLPFCSNCRCVGHMTNQCVLQRAQQSDNTQTTGRSQNYQNFNQSNQNYRPRYNAQNQNSTPQYNNQQNYRSRSNYRQQNSRQQNQQQYNVYRSNNNRNLN
jgi:hypothetical protein